MLVVFRYNIMKYTLEEVYGISGRIQSKQIIGKWLIK